MVRAFLINQAKADNNYVMIITYKALYCITFEPFLQQKKNHFTLAQK